MINSSIKSILVIDDDITIRKLLLHHLNNNDYKAFDAKSAAEGFTVLEKENIDLVLCDVTMDEIDGFTFCRRVRENHKYKALPFVFVTAKNSLEDKSIAHDAGGDDFITKPFDVNELLIKVRTLIRRTDVYKVYGVKKNLLESYTKSTPKILLVEDDKTTAGVFKFNLEKAGFDCSIASNVKKGLELARSIKPDVIVSDIIMPEPDGFQFRKMLLEDDHLRSLPFVFLTSKNEEKDILKGFDSDITDYILKDFGPQVFVEKIKSIINSTNKEKLKIVNELNLAAESLRAKVVPDNNPQFEGFKIKHWHKPFEGIPGGDFIDYFQLDDNNLAVVLGDVMGKKWSAWYFAFAYAAYIRSAIRGVMQSSKVISPKEILRQVNSYVYQDAKVSEVFATISLLLINKNSRLVRYSGAGDLPLFFKENISTRIETISSKGSLLGFSQNGDFPEINIELGEKDILLLVTDGIIESRSQSGDQYGVKRLSELMLSLNGSYNLLETLQTSITDFTSGKFDDDLSAVLIQPK